MTPEILQTLDPALWKRHLWGAPLHRIKLLRDRFFWGTGAGTGYGQAIAVMLASAGATVFMTGRRAQKLEETQQLMLSLEIATESVHALAADITDAPQAHAAWEHITRRSAHLNGIIHSAALPQGTRGYTPKTSRTGNSSCVPMSQRRDLTSLMTPHLLKSNAVRIMFLTSEAGWAYTPGHGQYNVSKCTQNNLTMSLAAEWEVSQPELDVQINALIPGEAKTEMNKGSEVSPFSITKWRCSYSPILKVALTAVFFIRTAGILRLAIAWLIPRPYEWRTDFRFQGCPR